MIDISRLNRYVDVSHFHMETVHLVLQSLRLGDWMVSLDLQDTYLQVPVHPASHKFLRFCLGESVFQFRFLCFGLATALQVFTCIMAPVSSIMHWFSFHILRHLDDWLVLGSSFQELDRARDFLLWLCQELGIRINLAKSSLTPTQSLDYLGMRLQTSPLRVFPTPKRVLKLSSPVHGFLSCRTHPLPAWRQLLGVMSSLSTLVSGSCLCMRALQLRLSMAGPSRLDSTKVSWCNSCLEDLRWWSVESHLLAGRPLDLSLPDLELFTDASDSGWWASLGDNHLSGLWSRQCSQFSINHRELLAVLYTVQGFLPLLRGRSASLYADNTTALSYLHKEGGTHSATLNAVAQSILRFCETHRIQACSSVHSRSPLRARGFAQPPSSGFRFGVDPLPTSLLGGPPEVACDHRSLRDEPLSSSAGVGYFSPMSDPQSAGTDAMMQSWDGLQAYAFPPFSLLHRVPFKVRQSRGLELTLVASFWPQHPWFLDLLELLVEIPFFLPLRKDLLRLGM